MRCGRAAYLSERYVARFEVGTVGGANTAFGGGPPHHHCSGQLYSRRRTFPYCSVDETAELEGDVDTPPSNRHQARCGVRHHLTEREITDVSPDLVSVVPDVLDETSLTQPPRVQATHVEPPPGKFENLDVARCRDVARIDGTRCTLRTALALLRASGTLSRTESRRLNQNDSSQVDAAEKHQIQ